jgi:hypothetical protein
MLNIVGTDSSGKKILSKVIIDDSNHLTVFGWVLCVLDFVTDVALFALIYKLIRESCAEFRLQRGKDNRSRSRCG